ncbi:protein-L-isoaspartate O-methyltransferase family protein [Parapedomonas caeni]|jgi:protein-L-isoaspartate(D-aspartate) O-methyltransferase
MPTAEQLRANMVAGQLRTNRVADERLVAALRAIPRETFVPETRRAFAYIDEDLPLGGGRFLMEPMVFGRLLDEAEVQPRDKVLIVGAGTGYSAAILARVAGQVVALEQDAALAATARQQLAALGNVKLVEGALTQGAAADGPYDLIVIEGAVDFIPDALVEQLSGNGRLVTVINDHGVGRGVVGRRSGTGFGVMPFMDAQVQPLPGFGRPASFTF